MDEILANRNEINMGKDLPKIKTLIDRVLTLEKCFPMAGFVVFCLITCEEINMNRFKCGEPCVKYQ